MNRFIKSKLKEIEDLPLEERLDFFNSHRNLWIPKRYSKRNRKKMKAEYRERAAGIAFAAELSSMILEEITRPSLLREMFEIEY